MAGKIDRLDPVNREKRRQQKFLQQLKFMIGKCMVIKKIIIISIFLICNYVVVEAQTTNINIVATPTASAPASVIYTFEAGDSLWSVAKKFYHDPAKWPLIRKLSKIPIVNPNMILNGEKLVVPLNANFEKQHRAVAVAWLYKEKSYTYRKSDNVKMPWLPEQLQPGANLDVDHTNDGRIYVLALDGVTVYGFDINYYPICQFSIQQGLADTYHATGIAFRPDVNSGTFVFSDATGKIRLMRFPMPKDFSPLPTPKSESLSK
jgi:LysM repeat protein